MISIDVWSSAIALQQQQKNRRINPQENGKKEKRIHAKKRIGTKQ